MRSEEEIKMRLLSVIATMLEFKDYTTLKQMKDTLEWVLSSKEDDVVEEEEKVTEGVA